MMSKLIIDNLSANLNHARMKIQRWFKVSAHYFLWLFIVPTAMAQDGMLYFEPQSLSLKPMEKASIALWAKDLSDVYGVELQLEFDNENIQLINSNAKAQDVFKLKVGEMFDKSKNFTVQNKVDNSKGTISYLITLLNPAPAVEAEGMVFKFDIQAKELGNSTIKFTTAKLGTKAGKVLKPSTKNLSIEVNNSLLASNKFLYWIIGGLLLFLVSFLIVRIKNNNKGKNSKGKD